MSARIFGGGGDVLNIYVFDYYSALACGVSYLRCPVRFKVLDGSKWDFKAYVIYFSAGAKW